MSLTVFLAVLFSAFFQAGWNFLTKKSQAHKIALLAVGWFFLGIGLLPFAVFSTNTHEFSTTWIPYLVASGLIHAFYLCFLGWAYSVGEISVVYPISRGLGIVGTATGSLILGLHGISEMGMIGISCVVGGTFLIGLKEVPQQARRYAFFLALLVALTVSSYSIVDSLGAKKVPIFIYLTGMNLTAPLFAGPFLLTKMRTEMLIVLRNHKWEAFFVAFAGSFAYAIILWAYQQSATAYVAALREFSVVIASLLGLFFLKEQIYNRKIFGIALILAGVICLRFAS